MEISRTETFPIIQDWNNGRPVFTPNRLLIAQRMIEAFRFVVKVPGLQSASVLLLPTIEFCLAPRLYERHNKPGPLKLIEIRFEPIRKGTSTDQMVYDVNMALYNAIYQSRYGSSYPAPPKSHLDPDTTYFDTAA